jgi:hypothetical protein
MTKNEAASCRPRHSEKIVTLQYKAACWQLLSKEHVSRIIWIKTDVLQTMSIFLPYHILTVSWSRDSIEVR